MTQRLATVAALAATAPLAGAAVAVPRAAPSAARGGAPIVEAMVVGRTATLFAPRDVRAGATMLAIGAKRCAVAAATPLAVLAVIRGAGGPPFSTRDYGSCSTAPQNSSSLFVYAIGGDVNSGHNGWVYKVDQRIGSTGAADTSGPFGDGHRLHSGQQVVWFWCNAGRGGHCQHSLGLRLPSRRVATRARLVVIVLGYDDQRRATPVAGATVTLAGATATSARNGTATLIAPRAARRYAVTAKLTGLVPAFPVSVRVT